MPERKNTITRRRIIQQGMAGAAAAVSLAGCATTGKQAATGKRGANDRIRVAVAG